MTESKSNAKLAPEIVETAELAKGIEHDPIAVSEMQTMGAEAADRVVEPEATEVKTSLGALQEEEKPAQKAKSVDEVSVEAKDTPAVAKPPTDAELLEQLLRYLEEDSFTMDVTERQLRSRLEKHFGVPLKDRKTIIRDKVIVAEQL